MQVHAITLSVLCLAVGTLLLIANLPVFYAIVANTKLRIRYGISTLVLLAAIIAGELRNWKALNSLHLAILLFLSRNGK